MTYISYPDYDHIRSVAASNCVQLAYRLTDDLIAKSTMAVLSLLDRTGMVTDYSKTSTE